MDRILVVLPNWYGETLFATPFLRALRAHQPTAFMATLGWPQCKAVLLHNPHVDELIDFDEHGAQRNLAGTWRLIQALRVHRFDAAFILRRSFSRSFLLAAAGIPVRIGFNNPKSGWLLTHRIPASSGPRHKAAAYLPLLQAVGASATADSFDYVVDEAERRSAHALLNGQGAIGGGPLVILHPGANWPHKRWPVERFAALGDRLGAGGRSRVAVTGSPDDLALAEAIRSKMHQPPVVLAGRTTLRELGACLEQARLVVSNDTGVLHVAAALRTPLVALYGPTSPVLTGPLGDPRRMVVLHHPDCCPRIPCYQPDRPAHPGMDSISVDEVYAAAVKLLEQNQ